MSTETEQALAELALWKQRWQALDSTAETLISRLCKTPDFYHKSTLLHALRGLRQFSKQSFDFLLDGFYEKQTYNFLPLDITIALQNVKNGDLKTRRYGLPSNYILNYTLTQVGYDLEMLHRVIEQLQLEFETSLQQFNQTLQRADHLAWSALQPVMLKSSNMTVITYFQRGMTVRILPYASIALIGIPVSCLTTPQDLLAIPHEVGHFIYWQSMVENGQAPNQQMRFADTQKMNVLTRRKLFTYMADRGLPDAYQGWMEEIFADAYGCWIAGPLIGRTAQFLQMCRPEEEFLLDDGHYPTPVLRPLIYAALLGEFQHMAAAKELACLWKKHIQCTWNIPDEELTKVGVDLQNDPYYLTSDILKWVGHVKRFIVDELNPNETKHWYVPAATQSVDEQLKEFVEYHRGTELPHDQWPPPPKLAESVPSNIWDTYLDVHNLSLTDASQEGGSPTTSSSEGAKDIEAENWWQIVKFGGWATEGPDGPKAHK